MAETVTAMREEEDGSADHADGAQPERVKRPRVEDKWVDGLLQYLWRDRLTLVSDPRGVLARGTGTGMWAAGEVLSDYFADHEELCRGATCLELGAGIGVVGLTVAHLGAKVVVLTDVARQIPLLEKNAAANEFDGQVLVKELDWTKEEQRCGLQWKGCWSLIVGSDIGYDPSLFEPLCETLREQCGDSTRVLLALADREEEGEPNVQDFLEAASPYFDASVLLERRAEPHQSLTKILLLRQRRK
ncbi:unnamed protein product [Durusdinium trenchii]|uniref:Calmodulin-lysine N-methyltransferase n=1 Tax=Durusdinium trenchii TaxID=1381693 RepID=A0ABP0LMH8_9DINO